MRSIISQRRQIGWKLAAVLGAIVLVALLSRLSEVRWLLREALDWIGRMEGWAPALFIGIYVLATVLFIPGTILSLGAGALFGAIWGSVYVSIGSTAGAACAFLVGRYIARKPISRRIEEDDRFIAVDRAIAEEGWKVVLLVRLSPIFPFTLLNYAFGVTQVSFWPYVWASWCGMLPATVVYVYIGSVAKVGLSEQERSLGQWVLYGIGLAATIAVTFYVARLAQRALRARMTGVDSNTTRK